VIESWDRHAEILANVMSLITEETRGLKPSEDGRPLDRQLCHIHECRREFLNELSPELAGQFGDVMEQVDGQWKTIDDLDEIKSQVAKGGAAVGRAVREAIEKNMIPAGRYTHPVMFMQHMLWHEGWHVGLIMLGLRLGGKEPEMAWEEPHMWEIWRGPDEF
jgi:uncharacterized damage-inducible protein DinB